MMVILIAAIVVLLLPSDAVAWGPVTHIVHGTTVLTKLADLPKVLQELLSANAGGYLYGCIGADIIQAKAYTKSLVTHCHSWPVAWNLVKRAESEREQAFAWGYMTHLAADILAHNHFVPSSLLRSFDAPTLGHAYWEARADSLQGKAYPDKVKEILRDDYEDCDALVERAIDHTLFSFKTNKRIFDSLMGLSKLEQWQRFVRTVGYRSRFPLAVETVDRYNAACCAAALDVMVHAHESYTQRQDATGREVLRRSSVLGRKLRLLKRSGRLTTEIESAVIDEFESALPDDVPPASGARKKKRQSKRAARKARRKKARA